MVGINEYLSGNWWVTVSGAGTTASGVSPSWADDYTRTRFGIEATYSGTDTLYGRKPIADVNP
jgi:hypothetical protein